MKTIFSSLFLLLSFHLTVGQFVVSQQWKQVYAGNQLQTRGMEIGVDSLENVYTTGRVWDQAGPLVGPGRFLVKQYPWGQMQWFHALFSDSLEILTPKIDVAPDGRCLVAGAFYDSLKLDFPNSPMLYSQGERDLVVYELTPQGNLSWFHHFTNPGDAWSLDVQYDAQGNVVIGGLFTDSLEVDPGPGEWWVVPQGFQDVFLLKLSPAGSPLWVSTIGGTGGTINMRNFDIGPGGRIALTGTFSNSVDFDPGPNSFQMDSGIFPDLYVLNLTASGQFLWAKAVGGTGSLEPANVCIDPYGHVITTGNIYIDSIDFDPGSGVSLVTWPSNYYGLDRTVFIQKLRPNGEFAWVKQLTGGTPDENFISARALVADSCGNVYACGTSLWGADVAALEPGGGSNHPENHNTQIYLAKIDAFGDLIWMDEIGYHGEGDQDAVSDMAMSQDRDLFLTGTQYYLYSERSWFLSKYSQPNDSTLGGIDSLQVIACGSYYGPSGQVWDSSGVYWDTLPNCPAVYRIDLTIGQNTDSTLKVTGCAPFELNGYTYNQAGIYTQYLTNSQGCDSILSVDLAILPNSTNTLQDSSCNFYQINGESFTSSGLYTQHFTNSLGCDSTLFLDLTIWEESYATLSDTACESYSLNGETFLTSGTFSQLLTNEAGCDSVLTLELTLLGAPDLGIQQADTILEAAPGYIYQWLDCGNGSNPIPGATDQQLITDGTGSYAVIVSNELCTDTSDCFSFSVSSIETFPPTWQLYPNPSDGWVQLSLDQSYPEVEIRVFDLQGKELTRKVAGGRQQMEVALPAEAGVYLLEVQAGELRGWQKVIRQ